MGACNSRRCYPYFILAGVFVILLIRNRYSFCWSDESLYVSNMYRLYQGDAFGKDEWNSSMLSSYVTLPLFSVFMLLKGSTDGVYIFFRDVCVTLAFLTAASVYRILSKQFKKGTALACSLCLMIYSRANICGCSYYNMGLFLFALADCLFYDACWLRKGTEKNEWVLSIFAGMCLGMSIIVNPYFILFLLLLCLFYRKDRSNKVLAAIGGCVFVGAVFLLYYLNSIGLNEFLVLIRNAGSLDAPSVTDKIVYWFVCLFAFFKETIVVQVIVLALQIYLRQKAKKYDWIRYLLLFISLACFGFHLYSSANMLGGAYIALAFLGIQVLPVIAWEEIHTDTIRKSILYFYTTGILMSMAFEIASNNGVDAAGIGFVIVSFGAVIALSEYAGRGKMPRQKTVMEIICLGSVLGVTMFLRVFSVYRDDVLPELRYQITQGPAEGLYTTKEHLEQYDHVCDDIREYINADQETSVFIGRIAPWAYLCTSARCGVYTTWRLDFSDPRLEQYYENHSEPEKILILDPEYGGFQDNYIPTWGENGDLTPNANNIGGYLSEYMDRNGYQCMRVRSGMFYFKSKEGYGKGEA